MSIKENKWPEHPKIYQINTWTWLNTLSQNYNRKITLQNIPDEIINGDITNFDAIWLMGVWERSPQGREIALNHPDLQEEYRNALSDFEPKDVVGSPYSVYYYRVDNHLGGNDGLASFRERLKDRDILLILDFVPNHVAVDHMWTLLKSNVFIMGITEDLISRPNEFFKAVDQVYANGRDPYFSPWTDSIQINAFSSEARKKAVYTLLNIARQCDGVRCDMAMLVTNKVFSQTWGARAGSIPEKEYWVEIIPVVREKFPSFLFIAEVYWDMEWELQQQGFDFCYDKKLYKRMLSGNAQNVRSHLNAEWDYQSKLVRFIENHDEERVMTKFGEERSYAAAILNLTLPGARLVHEGQMKGFKTKLPIQLGRRPIEEENQKVHAFYKRLLNIASKMEFEKGKWDLCDVEPSRADNYTYTNLISYIWSINEQSKLVVVNFSSAPAQGHVKIEGLRYGAIDWTFTDLITLKKYTYKGGVLDIYGLYIDLEAWNAHVFDIQKVE